MKAVTEQTSPTAVWLGRGDGPEWELAWRGLLAATGDADVAMKHPDTGEVWQYMGTHVARGTWMHTFRHRRHPVRQIRDYAVVSASASFVERFPIDPRAAAEAEAELEVLIANMPLDPVTLRPYAAPAPANDDPGYFDDDLPF